MKIDLTQKIEGFDYELGLDVESFLNQNTQLIGQPYNHHDVKGDKLAIQTIKAHHRVDNCDIYQDRTIHYTLDGKIHNEVNHELSFSGNQQTAQEFLEDLLNRYK